MFYRIVLLILILSLVAATAFAAIPVELTEQTEQVHIGRYIDILKDAKGELSIEQVSSDQYSDKFYSSPSALPNYGITTAVYWARLIIQDVCDTGQSWLLNFGVPLFEHVDLYVPLNDGTYQKKAGGISIPYRQKEIQHWKHLFPLTLEQGKPITYYMRFQTDSTLLIDLSIWKPEVFEERNSLMQVILGIAFGVFLVLILSNTALSIALRSKLFLYYVFFLISFLAYQMSLTGLSAKYLFPFSPYLSFNSTLIFCGLAMFAGLIFSRSFLNTKKYMPVFDKVGIVLMGLSLVAAISTLFSFLVANAIISVVGFCCFLYILAASIQSLRSGFTPARYFLLAWALFIFGGIFFILTVVGIFSPMTQSIYGMIFGFGTGGVLLSFALGDRINTMYLKYRKETEEKIRNYTIDLNESVRNLQEEISQRMRAQKEMEISEQKFRTLYESSTDAVMLLDENGFFDCNPAALEIFGCESLDQFISRHPSDFSPKYQPDGEHSSIQAKKQIEEALLKGSKQFEWDHMTLDGCLFPADVSLNALELTGKKVVQAVVRDISEQKKAREELLKKASELERSNKELQQFAYVASHDLQEPLRMVASYMQLIARRYKGQLDQDADEFIDFAVDGAVRMQKLIHDLLSYSRLTTHANKLKRLSIDDVLQEVQNDLKPAIVESGTQILIDTMPEVIYDEVQLKQLFQNLIANAIKFRGENIPKIQIRAQRKVNGWQFSVEDNGIGIDPEFAERIFVMFQRLHARAKYAGTGIGLAICKKIIERHGGKIWLVSEPEKGATFYFTIPDDIPKMQE